MREAQNRHVLMVGVTTRALAVSAARAGFEVTAIDAFGDLDLRKVARVLTPRSMPGLRFRPLDAAVAADDISAGLVAYTSNLENHPAAVERLALGRRLLGNPPEVLIRVRNPLALAALLRRRGFAAPLTRATPVRQSETGTWLLKPRRSGGGHGVQVWRAGRPVPRSSYLQQLVPGVPGSVIFAANGESAVVLGLSRQLVGDPRFGSHGFRYCGSLIGGEGKPIFPRYGELLETATALAREVTRAFGLVGLNGIDFIARNGIPYPIEVNPRYSASMELLERAHGLSLFDIHRRACEGILPVEPHTSQRVEGKAIVFARRDIVVGKTDGWLARRDLADVPHQGEVILAGRPICTVFATGSDHMTCVRRLVRQSGVMSRRVRTHSERAA